MSDQPINLLMVGLTGSGKTTYLAGLFHTLHQAPQDELSLRTLPEEREYLLTLERRWLDLEPIAHSAHVGPKHVELPVRDAHGRSFDLILPDVSGEEYRDAWEHGAFSEEIAQLLRTASGLLLFIHAQDLDEPELMDLRADSDGGQPESWVPKMGVTQAKLCDLLEQIVELRAGGSPSLAVIISAWDTVEPELSPDDWLTWKLPLLAQWLTASELDFRHKLFGISAQGGDLSDPHIRDRLATAPRVERPGGTHRLTAPLQWLLDARDT